MPNNGRVRYVRYESPQPNPRGAHIGIFGLANGLARSGRLSPADWAWWRAANDRYDAAYLDPATVDPTLFDKAIHPITTCWCRTEAEHLLSPVTGYLDLLDRYQVAWQRCDSDDPGLILYQDPDQVVVAPYSADGRQPGVERGRTSEMHGRDRLGPVP